MAALRGTGPAAGLALASFLALALLSAFPQLVWADWT